MDAYSENISQELPKVRLDKKKFGKLALRASLFFTAVSLVAAPIDETVNSAKEVGVAAGAGALGGEIAWNVGYGLMLIAAGLRVGNPIKFRSRIDEIKQNISDSKLFKYGLAINTIGALTSNASITYIGVNGDFPVGTRVGVLGYAAVDLAATIIVRKTIYDSIGGFTEQEQLEQESKCVVIDELEDDE